MLSRIIKSKKRVRGLKMGDNFASIKRMATPIVQKVKSENKLDPTME